LLATLSDVFGLEKRYRGNARRIAAGIATKLFPGLGPTHADGGSSYGGTAGALSPSAAGGGLEVRSNPLAMPHGSDHSSGSSASHLAEQLGLPKSNSDKKKKGEEATSAGVKREPPAVVFRE
jgi:hypothetical protein